MSDVLIMNKGEVQSLAEQFGRKAEEIQQIKAAISSTLAGTTWDGARARRFREQWEGQFAPNLEQLIAALEENSVFIRQELTNAITAMD